MKVLISGAGISGLSAALVLRSRGHHVTILERASAFQTAGAGIVIAPNAGRILERHGVNLPAVAQAVPSMSIHDAKGATLQQVVLPVSPSHGPTYALTRQELHSALASALPSDVDVRFGESVAHIEDSGPQLRLGTSAGEVMAVDVLVGADGIHSTTRQLCQGDFELHYAGYTCWRGICPNPGIEEAIEAWGGRGRIGAVPMKNDRLYVYLTLTAPRQAPALTWSQGLHEAFGGFLGPAARVFQALDGADLLHHDIEELPAPVWGLRRIVLIGDAAHAMTPNLGQGAALGIEDGLVLADELGKGVQDLAERLGRRRQARVRRVQRDSRRLGEVAHWTSPMATGLRDGLLRSTSGWFARMQYQRVVSPGLALVDAS